MNKYSDVSPLADFDWSSFESGQPISSAESQELAQRYAATVGTVQQGQIVQGKVVEITKREVTVDIGMKTNATLNSNEFRYNTDLAVGDTVEVLVKELEDKDGRPQVSHTEAQQERAWDRINAALENKEVVKGYIADRTKGGMLVEVLGVTAFLPGSQIDVRPITDFDEFVGKTMEFRVIKVNQEFKNVVVSHRALIQEELDSQREAIISQLEKGQVLEGVVKNITTYGAFVDLGGVDGLIHITDLSWGRVNSPREVLEVEQKINVVVLDYDPERRRIALGLKQLTPHPWDSLDPELNTGDKVKGKVVVITEYGAFVEVIPGVEGLVHVSEMSWQKHIRSPHDILKVGDEVECQILTLDREERKMSLGMKQLVADPWESVHEKYPVGSRHTATVRNFTNFGVFVDFENGVDGLVHISDLSWTHKVKHPSEFTQIGTPLEVVVLEIDLENRRLSLGHKQTQEDPWNEFARKYTVGSLHTGVISKLLENGAIITLEEQAEGFSTPRHMVKEDGSQPQVGEELTFKVIDFNRESRRIILSHSRTYEDANRETAESEKAEQDAEVQKMIESQAPEKATFGDLSELSALREQLQEEEAAEANKEADASEK